MSQFVHLRLHSEYSLIDGLVRLKPLISRAVELGMPAVAVTDHCNFYGLVKFQKAAQAGGIKPIYGCDFLLQDEAGGEDNLLTLYAQNDTGYRNVTELISLAYQKGQVGGQAFLQKSWIEHHCEGVIALSGGKFGDVGRALLNGDKEAAREYADYWSSVFPNSYYLELQRTGRVDDEEHVHAAVELAKLCSIPVVATNDVRFLDAEDYEAHESRVCIHDQDMVEDPKRVRRYTNEQYLRSSEEMCKLFADIPSAIANTIAIARRCTAEAKLGTYFLPEYPIPKGDATDTFFRKICYEGLDERLDFLFDRAAADFPERERLYRERLRFELDIILQMGFPGYFLIVMDFIQWGKDHEIPVGPGRGSGAGSLVAYALKITDLDPLEYDLLFERFLNPERVSMPDFDVDFCMDNRDKVISYVSDNYGRNAVSQIVTFGTMAAKAVVRDVARVQGKPYGLADKLSKMIPFEVGMSLGKAFEQEEILRDFVNTDSAAGEIWAMAKKLEGTIRGVGKHAGGVVIAPTKLTDFAPLYCDDEGGGLVTQFDKGDVEDAGLVKFDFLGLRTLTIVDWAVRMIDRRTQRSGGEPLDIMAIPLEDKKTFELLMRAETTAVFQLESRGMKDLIKRLLPDCFEDIIALVALFRPGPLQSGMVENFINRKHGREEISFPDVQYQHECLEPILKPTYGIILYQEQVMQIAQELAGYSLGGADMLRRAMGKKKPEEMAKQRAIFEEGAVKKGIDGHLAMKIFDLVEKFAGYGFNKSHSAAYALVSYQTCWLKTHYPAEFMAATMSSELQNTDKIVIFVEECRRMELPLVLPDVNVGEYMFTVDDEERIVYGLGAIKGLGEGPVESLLEARKEGPFTDLFDFCARVDLRKVNKRALEALIRSGAFDQLGVPRSVLIAALPEAVKAAEQSRNNSDAGMMDLFGDVVSSSTSDDPYGEFRNVRDWTGRERLDGERDTLGLYVTGHPIDDYEHEIRKFVRHRIVDLRPEKHPQQMAGLIVDLRVMKSKRGDNIGFVTIDDRSARIEVAVFADCFADYRDKLVKDQIVIIEGVVNYDDYSESQKVRAKSISTFVEARQRHAKGVLVSIEHREFHPGFVSELQHLITRSEPTEQGYPGSPVIIDYQGRGASARLALDEVWRVVPDDESLLRLGERFGMDKVSVYYG
ncbi:DNA polymerase-3 subunit alpha [Sinobacterium caligoides]|uniref:DNA polymerase III subunit alpha n=1 Tax=Sinobacterium caligoides TaxID=933926 RepID=A0A3N2DMK9_9GAMM|nr:DNA polymerase III subunit alpha [Sinobacterium caligoides]ROS01033.1 DNA polymerase-3 subunit alpha [Sinobacterium caligoides]